MNTATAGRQVVLNADGAGLINLGRGKKVPSKEIHEALETRFGVAIVDRLSDGSLRIDLDLLPEGAALHNGFCVMGVEAGVSPIAPYLRGMLGEGQA